MPAALDTLPAELLEHILVQTLSGPGPSAEPLLNLSLSCRRVYRTIHHPDNTHVWFALFLAVFDDPGCIAEWKAGGRPGSAIIEVDWKSLFVQRITAQKVLGHISSKAKRVSRSETTEALLAIISAISSISPANPASASNAGSLTSIWSPFSTFFATSHENRDGLAVIGSLPSTFAAHLYPLPLPITHFSRNAQWVGSVLLSKKNDPYEGGHSEQNAYYPRRLLVDHILASSIGEDEYPTGASDGSGPPFNQPHGFWDLKLAQDRREKELEGRAFAKIVFLMGSGPISTRYPPILIKKGFSRLPFHGNVNQGAASNEGEEVEGTSGSNESGTPTSALADPIGALIVDISGTEVEPSESDAIGELMSMKSNYDLARQRARRTVYHMGYLMKERSWGPFEVHGTYKARVEERERRRAQTRANLHRDQRFGGLGHEMAWIPAVLQHFGVFGNDDNEDEDDEDFVQAEEESEDEGNGGENEENSDEGDDEDESEGENVMTQILAGMVDNDDSDTDNEATQPELNVPEENRSESTRAPTEEPQLHQYEPDFAFLAACRIVIEANLRERGATSGAGGFVPPVAGIGMALGNSVTTSSQDAIKLTEVPEDERERIPLALEMLRAGSAPGYKGLFPPAEEDAEDNSIGKGKGKELENEIYQDGWDWAGVEGEWRRVVCFLDYRDLLLFNMQRDEPNYAVYLDPMQEAVRVFPMTLNVTGYSPPPQPSANSTSASHLVYKLPVIHFEGRTRGSDNPSLPSRRVTGTVRMCESGHVRWQMYSHNVDNGAKEWASENIQLGEIGSAMGVIGIWTGAEHARNDPLGPSWAWKIS